MDRDIGKLRRRFVRKKVSGWSVRDICPHAVIFKIIRSSTM